MNITWIVYDVSLDLVFGRKQCINVPKDIHKANRFLNCMSYTFHYEVCIITRS